MAEPLRIAFHGENARNFMEGFAELLPKGLDVDIQGLSASLSREGEKAAFEAADVVVGIRLDDKLPIPARAKLFHAPSAGTDTIKVSRLPVGCTLCNAFGHEAPIAEYVMAALLARHVPLAKADENLRKGEWTYYAGRPGALRTELGSETIGLLGFGHIGKAVAHRAKAFGMRVVVCNRSLVAKSEVVDQSFSLAQLREFMAAADHFIVSLPLAPETKGIVNVDAIAAMRPTATIVNVGRGPLIEEEPLYQALANKRIAGAIIDTWYTYPSATQPVRQPSHFDFSSLDNVVMTPHMSGWTDGLIRRRKETVAENVRLLVEGRPFINVVHRA